MAWMILDFFKGSYARRFVLSHPVIWPHTRSFAFYRFHLIN
jgi:hypothetical protein